MTRSATVPRINSLFLCAPGGVRSAGAMTTVRQLYSLQEVDLDLDRLDKQKAEAEQELEQPPALESMEMALLEEEVRLEEYVDLRKARQLEVETLRQRSSHLDEQLFGGNVANPRDLNSLEQEADSVRGQLEKQDNDLLELNLQVEESESKCSAMRQNISEAETNWQVRKSELQSRMKEIASERDTVSAQRNELASGVEATALQRYETLRLSKGGLAVAKVERGLCQGCRMSLPTQQQQRLRSGRQIVQCSTCSRLLLLS